VDALKGLKERMEKRKATQENQWRRTEWSCSGPSGGELLRMVLCLARRRSYLGSWTVAKLRGRGVAVARLWRATMQQRSTSGEVPDQQHWSWTKTPDRGTVLGWHQFYGSTPRGKEGTQLIGMILPLFWVTESNFICMRYQIGRAYYNFLSAN
jgi:hypothetical protein